MESQIWQRLHCFRAFHIIQPSLNNIVQSFFWQGKQEFSKKFQKYTYAYTL